MNDLVRQLRELPELPPPGRGWTRLESRLAAGRRRRQRRGRVAGLALAASILLVVLTLRPVSPPSAPDAVAGLMQQSQALERQLATLKSAAGVWDGGSARSAARLQSDVALLDVQLSELAFNPDADAGASTALWTHRIELLNQLVLTHRSPMPVRNLTTASPAAPAEAEILEL